MPDLGPHANFILAAYGFTFAAVAALGARLLPIPSSQPSPP